MDNSPLPHLLPPYIFRLTIRPGIHLDGLRERLVVCFIDKLCGTQIKKHTRKKEPANKLYLFDIM